MRTTKAEIRKLWLKARLERLEWEKEAALAHEWAMLAIKVGALLLVVIGLWKLA